MNTNTKDVVATLMWQGKRYRYTFVKKGVDSIPTWALWGWNQGGEDRIDIGQMDKHKGMNNGTGKIGWYIEESRFSRNFGSIVFSDIIPE